MACSEYESTKYTNTSKSKQKQPRPSHIQLRKRKRTISSTETDPLCLSTGDTNMELTADNMEPTQEPINPRDPLNLNSLQNNKKKKTNRNISNSTPDITTTTTTTTIKNEMEHMETPVVSKQTEVVTKNRKNYIYGNYPCYYGYRMECSQDPRFQLFKSEMFSNKKCLDIGCNSGAITIKIAQDFTPLFIQGLDIDPELIKRAKRAVKWSLLSSPRNVAPPEVGKFPQNINFRAENYVPPCDTFFDTYQPDVSYDVILCLSVTKWVHLNWGDEGIKRMFKRIYLDLSPTGVLILEAQGYSGYAKRAKLSPHMEEHFRSIKLRPSLFGEFLTSEIGFGTRELMGTPPHTSRGFQRDMELYWKQKL